MSQSEFRAALLDPTRPEPAGLTDPAGRPAGRRFDIYRNNVTIGLIDALELTFPAIRKLVGDDFFRAMARAFARAHPPVTPLMMFYGEAMPGFLAQFPPVAELGYLPDIARLELALRRAYHAADSVPLPAAALAAVPPDRLLSTRMVLAPAVQLVASPWPIHAIWHANMADGPAPVMRPEAVIVVRPAFDPAPWLLPPGGDEFLAELAWGHDLGTALAAAGDGFDLTAMLGLLLRAGAITNLEGTDDEPDPRSA